MEGGTEKMKQKSLYRYFLSLSLHALSQYKGVMLPFFSSPLGRALGKPYGSY